MWRAYDANGFLQYSFVESVVAVHPFFVIRMLGGLLFLIGALIMAYNLIMTVRSPRTAPEPQPERLPAGMRRRRREDETMFIRQEFIEQNAILLLVLTLVDGRDRRDRRDRAAVHDRNHGRAREGRAPLLAAGADGPRHLRARGLLSLPQPAGPRLARRGGTLRPLQPRGGEHVRPSVPVGLQAHRAGPGAGRGQVFQRLALCASGEPAGDGAGEPDAALRVPGAERA